MPKITVRIYTAENCEFSFRVKAGNARITMTPGETYKRRQGVRAAVRLLADMSTFNAAAASGTDAIRSQLALACHAELDREMEAWNKRRWGATS